MAAPAPSTGTTLHQRPRQTRCGSLAPYAVQPVVLIPLKQQRQTGKLVAVAPTAAADKAEAVPRMTNNGGIHQPSNPER